MTSSHLCTNRLLKPELCAYLMLVTQWLIWVIPRVTCFGPSQHLERWRFGSLTRTTQGRTTNSAFLNFFMARFVFKYQSFVKKKLTKLSQQAVTAHFSIFEHLKTRQKGLQINCRLRLSWHPNAMQNTACYGQCRPKKLTPWEILCFQPLWDMGGPYYSSGNFFYLAVFEISELVANIG